MESKPKYGISRYNNIAGITCYMNSILHILQQIPIFADYIYTASFSDSLKEKFNEEQIKNSITFGLYKLFNASMNNDDVSITPTSFKHVIGLKNEMWNEFNHQDSQEFFSFLVSSLEEEIGTKVEFIPGNLVKTNTSYISLLASMAWQQFQAKEYSPLKDIFNGMFYIQTRCNCCSNISRTFEPFTTLQVAIPIISKQDITKEFTIDECLHHLIKEEQLDNDNMYNCEMCGLKNKGYKESLLWRTPKLLVIHIKRFLVDNYGSKTQKLINNIKYPLYDFDVSDYIHSDSPFKEKSKYNLIGVNLHQGFGSMGTNAGHYTSFVKNRFDDNWYLFNDGNTPLKATKKEHIQNKNAYLLFYYRTN